MLLQQKIREKNDVNERKSDWLVLIIFLCNNPFSLHLPFFGSDYTIFLSNFSLQLHKSKGISQKNSTKKFFFLWKEKIYPINLMKNLCLKNKPQDGKTNIFSILEKVVFFFRIRRRNLKVRNLMWKYLVKTYFSIPCWQTIKGDNSAILALKEPLEWRLQLISSDFLDDFSSKKL